MNSAVGAAQSKPGMLVAVTDPESNAMVAKTPGAIGATGLTSIMVENLSLNTLTLNGVKGTTQNLSSGAYPLAKDIRFITMTTISPAAVKLLKFVFSREGRSIAEKAGVFVPASSSFSN
jgi:phosphate transport system substrate-binding protein